MLADTLIVGGGLAGLRLADRLREAGSNFVLVEARDFLGGRIDAGAARDSKSTTNRYDLGPAWFWPGQPRMADLAHDLGLRVFEQYATGDLVMQEANGTLQIYGMSTMARALRLEGGMISLIERLQQRFPAAQLLPGHKVTRLEQAGSAISAHLVRQGEHYTISANRVVLALPPRLVASNIAFDPPLPEQQKHSLRQIPTWMAGHAKLVAIYATPFWRDADLSGDGISRRGPLAEIHDASPFSGEQGALFGFFGVPARLRAGKARAMIEASIAQLVSMFGEQAANPRDVLLKDWAEDSNTAMLDDLEALAHHPTYGMPAELADMWDGRLVLASTEVAPRNGGLLEGALESAEAAFQFIMSQSAPTKGISM